MLVRRKLPLWVSGSPGVPFGPNLFALNVPVEHQHLWISSSMGIFKMSLHRRNLFRFIT